MVLSNVIDILFEITMLLQIWKRALNVVNCTFGPNTPLWAISQRAFTGGVPGALQLPIGYL